MFASFWECTNHIIMELIFADSLGSGGLGNAFFAWKDFFAALVVARCTNSWIAAPTAIPANVVIAITKLWPNVIRLQRNKTIAEPVTAEKAIGINRKSDAVPSEHVISRRNSLNRI